MIHLSRFFAIAAALVLSTIAAPLSQAASQDQLLATLESNAPLPAKWAAAHQLAGIATPDAVPKLSTWLAGEQMADLARYVLETLPAPSVDDALRAMLGKLQGDQLAGVITSLGVRRNAGSVEPLVKFLKNEDLSVLSATVAALGKIGTVAAAKALEDAMASAPENARREFYASLIQCADTLLEGGARPDAVAIFNWVRGSKAPAGFQAAAVRGLILANGESGMKLLAEQLNVEDISILRLVQESLPAAEVAQVLVSEMPKLPLDRQILIVQALGHRGDIAALSALINSGTGNKLVRMAAIRSIPHNPLVVRVLAKLVSDTDLEIAQAARERLASLPEPEADAAILGLFSDTNSTTRLAAIQMTSRRRLHAAAPALLMVAQSNDATLSVAAINTLGGLATEADLPAVLKLLSNETADLGALERALIAICGRSEHPDTCADQFAAQWPKSPTAAKGVLLRVLGEVGGAKALQTVRQALGDSNNEIKTTAIRTLAKWRTADAAPDLLLFAKTAPDNSDKLLCVRGLLTLAGAEEIAAPQRLDLCQQAAPLCAGVEEKKLLLSALSRVALPESVTLILPHLESGTTRQEAGAAVLAVADRLLQSPQAAVNAAALVDPLTRVSDAAVSPDLVNRAKPLLKKAAELSPKPVTPTGTNSAQLKAYPFFPFCIDWHDSKKRSFKEQADMLKELGYEGVGHIWLDGVADRIKTLDDVGLKLFQITMVVDLSPGKTAYDARFKEVLALVKGRHVQFDLLLNGMPPSDASVDARAVQIIREMSDLAQESGAQLLLYPHQGSWVERIEDSVRVADKVDRPNVGIMFNLCHWLRVDDQRDYKPLLQKALPRLWAISINGADESDPAPGWDHYIQPLDKGSFNVGALLKTLKDLGYKGPIGLQCYGIGGDAREHLSRSIATWQKLSVNLKS